MMQGTVRPWRAVWREPCGAVNWRFFLTWDEAAAHLGDVEAVGKASLKRVTSLKACSAHGWMACITCESRGVR